MVSKLKTIGIKCLQYAKIYLEDSSKDKNTF